MGGADLRFSGRSALVTGGAGAGLGFSIARRLASEGARVAIVDRHERRTTEAVDRLGSEFGGAAAAGFVLDVADREVVAQRWPEIARFLGTIDVLVNNAATNALGPPSELTDSDWDRVLALNLTACFTLIRAALPGMQERGRGAIVNVSSIAAFGHGAGNNAPYAASKAGLNALTRSVAVAAGPYGVRCNAVAPGLMEGPFLAGRRDQFQDQLERTPLRRFAEPGDVAAVIAFLASDDARHVTGEVVNVSGGVSLRP
ncbi:MAG: SDR family NAD(P)-dependent oxidoreductase [Myxococcota bacterium]|nr:SDR family NAD(P)-dependent oxidoreductase [Myxococcota bacterium]